ncbi:MAG: tetratricopeptide repeat protein [Armatimonadetes bacterium]|nr:tetratricopeptide repeat protein [Armatimonadota bacterium]
MKRDEQLERILTRANIERVRGNFSVAKSLLEQALQKAPDRADIHELLGDVHKATGNLKSALECYKKSKELDPSRRSAEEKFAATLLEINQPSLPEEVPFLPKNPNYAAIFSAFLPGAGQIYNEQWFKGFIMLTVTLSSLGYFLQFFRQVRTKTISLGQIQQLIEQSSVFEILLLLFSGLLAFSMWTWSIIDAYKTACRFQQLQQKSQTLNQEQIGFQEGGKK